MKKRRFLRSELILICFSCRRCVESDVCQQLDCSSRVCVCVFCAGGVNDVNYGLYPSQELQRDWLTAYLESYKHSSGREVTVTEAEVTQLYVQVCKFSLVSVRSHRLGLKYVIVQCLNNLEKLWKVANLSTVISSF